MTHRLAFALLFFLSVSTISCQLTQPSKTPVPPPPATKFLESFIDTLLLDIEKNPEIEVTLASGSRGSSDPGISSSIPVYERTLFTQGHLPSEDRIKTLMRYLADRIDTQLRNSDVQTIYGNTVFNKDLGETYSILSDYSKITGKLRTKGFIEVLVTHRRRDTKGELINLVIVIRETTY